MMNEFIFLMERFQTTKRIIKEKKKKSKVKKKN